MRVALHELSYVLLPAEDVSEDILGLYKDVYRCWSEVYSETFKALDGVGILYSDDFTRQSFVGAIMKAERCVAVGLFHWVDFRLQTAFQDSYFKVWPGEAIAKLTKDGPEVLVGSNIAVDPEFRGNLGEGLSLKNLIVGLMVKTFLATPADAMTGTMRCNRGMDRASYAYGATPLNLKVSHHGVEVDLVSFYRRQMLKEGLPGVDLSVEALWRNRRDLTTQHRSLKSAAQRAA